MATEKAQEKAKELAISATKYVDDKGEEVYNVFCEAACMQMHEWDKQLFIEKACEWLKKNMIGLDMGKYPMYSPNFINDFRKVMEE